MMESMTTDEPIHCSVCGISQTFLPKKITEEGTEVQPFALYDESLGGISICQKAACMMVYSRLAPLANEWKVLADSPEIRIAHQQTAEDMGYLELFLRMANS